ncbi:BON domain-containing protein [Vulcaniibacterium tengchongense]|uniref:BON domain-containing protein n=1 Tax=Vulcaniibacterium tengchongense TaxID=1273429 RepID=A0A3N4VP05_9GAMM|nr:BON domain-containing protein [Vulcaniibacterium tengchongense]RPE81589.1 BON domain-containing protein [Vulcaniibacterium tengchongense]
MHPVLRVITAFAAGAAIMYYFDPVAGRRRRAMVRDRAVATRHDAEGFVRAKSKRAVDRVHGALARTRARISPEPVDDDRLHDRVRAKLGRVVERPSAIHVEVRDGRVVLTGSAAEAEIEELLDAVAMVQGVREVENRLSMGALAGGSEAEAGAPPQQNVQH